MIDARGMRGRSWCGRRTRQMDVARLPTTPSRGRRNSVACTPFASTSRPFLVSLPTHAGGKSIFTLTMRINFSRIIPPPPLRQKSEALLFFSFHRRVNARPLSLPILIVKGRGEFKEHQSLSQEFRTRISNERIKWRGRSVRDEA